MTSKHLRIATIAGIPISLDYSWFLIFFLLTWSLGASYFPAQFPGWPSWQYWVIGALATILLFVSVLMHELGHATVARHYHIQVGEITLFIFGGVAQLRDEPKSPGSEFWIAVAGPAVSLLLGLVFSGMATVITFPQALAVFRYVGYINLSLFLFNLIPGFPLDGGRVFRALIWAITRNMHKATTIAVNVGRLIAYGFIIVGLFMIFRGNFVNGLWMAFIGWFLESAAIAQSQQQKLRDILSRYQVRQAMSSQTLTIPAHLTLDMLADHYFLNGGKRAYLVQQDGQSSGLLTIHQLAKAAKPDWLHTTAGQVMIPLDQVKSVHPDDDLWTALQKMDRNGVNQLLVLDNDVIIGTLSREDLVSFLQDIQP